MPFFVKVLFYKCVMLLTRLVMHFVPDAKPLVLSGKGSSVQLSEAIAHFGMRKILLVTDKMLVKLGVIEPILTSLKSQGIEPVVFDGVEPDPTFDVVDAGLSVLRRHQCEGVLAVGGGSSIDAAKVIALAGNNDKTARQLEGKFVAKKPAMPLFAIPTTAGTGSEVTVAAVISDPTAGDKKLVLDPKLVPLVAALDPEIMLGLPPAITAATGMDALTHAVEAYISSFASKETDAYAVTATRMVIANLETAYHDGSNVAAREAMAMGAFYAGLAFTKAFVGYVHAIAHQFGAKYHTPHGFANALVLPHILQFSKDHVADRLATLAVECGLGERTESQSVLAQKFIDKVWAMNKAMGIPATLDALQAADIPDLAQAAMREGNYKYPVPKYMDLQQCQGILKKLLPV
ncbi:iron-containing alcohol dehydrogenase [Aestuariicella hydrocarbonica]|uniref:Iron-containing alcohol dehydrogenase n=1 Tax=Pseudomaricurvus hydrocarbonicus TaxID=1470433 RepID=A0A9E5T4I2_9GAMM|nr:iron-containing alcohol dehydrogenase [Aestuariicella hydrocarbonica]